MNRLGLVAGLISTKGEDLHSPFGDLARDITAPGLRCRIAELGELPEITSKRRASDHGPQERLMPYSSLHCPGVRRQDQLAGSINV